MNEAKDLNEKMKVLHKDFQESFKKIKEEVKEKDLSKDEVLELLKLWGGISGKYFVDKTHLVIQTIVEGLILTLNDLNMDSDEYSKEMMCIFEGLSLAIIGIETKIKRRADADNVLYTKEVLKKYRILKDRLNSPSAIKVLNERMEKTERIVETFKNKTIEEIEKDLNIKKNSNNNVSSGKVLH